MRTSGQSRTAHECHRRLQKAWPEPLPRVSGSDFGYLDLGSLNPAVVPVGASLDRVTGSLLLIA